MLKNLPFSLVFTISILLLSGCNLKTGTDAESAVISTDVTPPEVVAQDVAEPVEVEAVPTASYRVGAIEQFNQAKFETALADGKTVFLDFYASWCPTCRANTPIIDAAFDGSTDIVGFRVDYDNETELKKTYKVTAQSTYLVLKNGQELDRYLGALTAERLAGLLN